VQQVARRTESLRERGRRLDAVAFARVDRGVNLLASRRAPDRLDRALAARFSSAERGLGHRRERLIALSPDSVLARGYSITQDAESGAVVTAADAVKSGGRVRISLASGRLGARVDEVEP
jgi:exodeoxyribonuclease VII large subunit